MTPKLGVWILAAASCFCAPFAWTEETSASPLLIEKAEAGDTASQLALGIAAEDNETKPDYATAARWYRRASDAGSGMADWHLGMLYETGEGVEQSYDQARACYERALARGIEAAAMRLGLFYLEGWGVKSDRERTLALVTRAAESGYVPAMNVLSGMYIAGIGVAKNNQHALAWAERAAAYDDKDAQLTIGAIVMRDQNMRRDIRLARQWYQMSAEQEYTTAMLAMASTFLKRGATDDDRANGRRWLELALENQSSEAGFLLAVYEFTSPDGLTPPAETRARAFLERAVALGCLEASEVLELEKSGRPLRDSLRHVATVPMEVRYVARSARWIEAQSTAGNRPPKFVKAVSPVYPATLSLAKQEGTAVIRFVVDTKGFVQEPVIVSTTHPAFADSAIQAIRQFRFEPGIKDGRVVSTRMQLPIYFQLKVPVTRSSTRTD
ncbi:TonB family protein [Nibricoccus aquaticus]|nr:TonB family protein [Nibricoccus aquaticus]